MIKKMVLAMLAATIAVLAFPGQASAGSNRWTKLSTPSAPKGWTGTEIQKRHSMSRARIVFSPAFATDKTVFACFDVHDTGQSAGMPAGLIALLRSTDAGVTWAEVALPAAMNRAQNSLRIEVSPAFEHDATLLATTRDGGIWKSTSAGDAWTHVETVKGWTAETIPHYAQDEHAVAMSPAYASDKTIFAVGNIPAAEGSSVIKSVDGGLSWVQLSVWETSGSDEFDFRPTWVAVSPSFAQDKTVIVGGERAWMSTDAGITWNQMSLPASFEGELESLVFSPSFGTDRTLFARGAGEFAKSTDSGATWMKIRPVLEGALQVSPGFERDSTVFSGLSRSTDAGSSWRQFGTGFSIGGHNAVLNFAVPPTFGTSQTVYAMLNGYFCSYTFAATRPYRLTLGKPWRTWTGSLSGVRWQSYAFSVSANPPADVARVTLSADKLVGGDWKRYASNKRRYTFPAQRSGNSAFDVIDGAWVRYGGSVAFTRGTYRIKVTVPGNGDCRTTSAYWKLTVK